MSKSTTTPAPAPADVPAPAEATPAPAPIIAAEWSADTYRNGDPKVKGRIRADIQKALMVAVGNLDAVRAKALADHLATLTSTSAPKVEVAVEVILAARVAALRTAADMIESGLVTPDGIDTFDPAQVAFIGAARHAVDAVDIEAARKIAGSKITRHGKVNDVGQVILDALAAVPAGTVLTMAQVASTVDGLSDGAVAARVFPSNGKVTVEGIVAVERTATTARGVRLA